MGPGTSGGRCGGDGEDAIQSAGYVVVVCLCAIGGLALALRAGGDVRAHVPSAIEDTVNPSVASPASLARLPGIGPARARAIVSYRNLLARQGGAEPAFRRPEDLEAISGIGPGTVRAIRPWLSFED
jgi:hypothetical protein